MTTLRQKLIDELELRGMSRSTQESYVGVVSMLARHYHRAPDLISDEELRGYLLHLLRDRHNGASTLIVAVSALRFFYRQVLHRPTAAIETALPRMKRPKSLPRVFSPEQIARLLQVEELTLKHRTMLMTAYASGVRVSELCALRPEHILSERGQIRVEQGKGAKDRYTVLSPRLLEQLRTYWREERPVGGWLFPSRWKPGRPLSVCGVQVVYRRATRLAGVPGNGGIHSLRHSFATHLLEAGVPLTVIQRLLGHTTLVTTARYLHVRRETITGLHGLLEAIDLKALVKQSS